MRISFKNHPKNTGLRAVGNPLSDTDIKIDGKICGLINAPNWRTQDHKYGIMMAVIKEKEDGNPNNNWKWIHCIKRFDTIDEAKEWCKQRIPLLADKYQFHYFED